MKRELAYISEWRVDYLDTPCHICISHKVDTSGKIKYWYKGKKINASRMIYQQGFGDLPKTLIVSHKCRQSSCLNINHLEASTCSRPKRGQASDLPKKKELEICRIYEKNNITTVESIAKEYNIGVSVVSKILKFYNIFIRRGFSRISLKKEVFNEIITKHPNYEIISKRYRGAHYKLKIKCKKHNNIFESLGWQLKRENYIGCEICLKEFQSHHNDNTRLTMQVIKERIESISPNYTIPLNQKYKNTFTKIKVICDKHKEFKSCYSTLKTGGGCIRCWWDLFEFDFPENSKREKIIRSLIKVSKNHPQCNKLFQWSKKVRARDNYICQTCGIYKKKGSVAHYIYNKADYPELMLNINNGVTLCRPCHRDFHGIFTNTNNTLNQFYFYKYFKYILILTFLMKIKLPIILI